MEKIKVKMIREQRMDGETIIEEQEMLAFSLSENEYIYEYEEKEGLFTIRLLFHECGVFVKIFSPHYRARIPFVLHQKEEGEYHIGGKTMHLDFLLKKIQRKGFAIDMEYDIFSRQSVISNNTWKVKVI